MSSGSSRSRWFGGLLPVQACEDHTQDLRNIQAQEEPEEAVEVTEKSDLDAAAEDRAMPMAFNLRRHTEEISEDEIDPSLQSWRMRERMKTVSVALVICLNVGVDPPDVTKTQPCARMECWVDPTTLNPQRAIEAIGNNLQKQYERWQPKARYRQSLDPPLEEVRRLATGLRRNARDERVLFHYNGHGVPRPTANGEIWVFNRNYTQYIPLSLYDLQGWMGSPSIFVYDCSNAGIIVQAFDQFADQHEREYLEQVNSQGVSTSDLPPPVTQRNCIQLAACAANQMLPMNPDLPADLFTSCLTTPIKMALRWFVMQRHSKLAPDISVEMLDKIPGQFGDRRTMLGELNWIFTAITDTIAWNTLPRDLFQKLFRQDLLVASLFRNFLLADRIMRSYDCTPISQPSLPSMQEHGMWKAWDLAVDMALSQLSNILHKSATYKPSTFFAEQLTAFEVWLKFADETRPPPEQLPIVLQVLLSQAHRLRALDLLGRFLDIGPWAVHLALSVGIFPYILKLLQSSARELRPLLVSIWAKILAVDQTCQTELVGAGNHKYFLSVLQDECMFSSHRTLATFILATAVHNYKYGQQEAEQANLIAICLEYLDDPEPVLRQWLAIALGRVWEKHEKARWRGARDNAHEKLYQLLGDPVPEVRSAAVFALGTFISSCEERTEHANTLDHSITLHLLNAVMDDGSPLVRGELALALHHFVLTFEANFINICRFSADDTGINSPVKSKMGMSTTNLASAAAGNTRIVPSMSVSALDRLGSTRTSTPTFLASMSISSIYNKVWTALDALSKDPLPEIENIASTVILYVRLKSKEKEEQEKHKAGRVEVSSATSSVPSSPAKPTFVMGSPPPPTTAPVSRQLHRMSIKEEGDASGTPEENAKPRSVQKSTNPKAKPPSEVHMPVLKTNFLPWSSKYFNKQLMKHECISCDCDPESPRHWRKEWLYKRNLEVRSESETQRDLMKTRMCRLDHAQTSFRVPFVPFKVLFHPYNNQLAVAGSKHILVQNLDTSSEVCTMDPQSGVRHHHSHFQLHHMRGVKRVNWRASARFSDLAYVNAHEHALLLAVCDDGCLRVFRDQEESKEVTLVTAWNALKEQIAIKQDIKPTSRNRAGKSVVVAWEQKSRIIAVGGECRPIRIWDANTELRKLDLAGSDNGGGTTCLSFSPTSPNLLSAGFGDGTARIYDLRVSSLAASATASSTATVSHPAVLTYSDHSRQLLDCVMQDVGGYSGHLVTGAADGDIRVMDPRRRSTTRQGPPASTTIKHISLGQPVSGLSLHRRAFAAAAWTIQPNNVAVHTLLGNGALINAIRPGSLESGLLSSHYRKAPHGCVAFHPHLIQLATGQADGIVAVHTLRKTL